MTATTDAAGAAAFRAWRRLLQNRRPTGASAYAVYVVVLVTAVYGPMVWSLLASLGLGGTGGWPLDRVALLALGLAGVATVAAARAGVPLWVSRREAVYALSGQFRPPAVLWRRGVSLLVGAAVVGAFLGAAVASGSESGAALAMWAVWAAAMAAAPLALGTVAQVRRWRRLADGVVAVIVVIGAVVAAGPRHEPAVGCAGLSGSCAEPWVDAGPGLGGVVAAVVVAGMSWWAVLRWVPARLDADDVAARGTRSTVVGVGLAAGDTRATSRFVSPRYFGTRRALVATWAVVHRAPLLARDLVGQRRRPGVTLGGVGAALAGSWWVLTASSRLLVIVGALLLYVAAGALGLGMSAFYQQPVPGGLLPGSGRRVLAWHLVVPGAGLAVALLVSLGLTAARDGLDAPSVLTAVSLVLLALTARAWVASSTSVPVGLYTPVMTPVGDMSMVNVAAYLVRGWLIVAALAWWAATPGMGSWWPALVAAVICGILAASKAGR